MTILISTTTTSPLRQKLFDFLPALLQKLQAKYIVDPRSVKLFDGVLPSIHPGCLSASAAMAAQLAQNYFKPWQCLFCSLQSAI